MAKRRRHPLAIIHDAIVQEHARAILGVLSPDDLRVLAKRTETKSLVTALQPLADHEDLRAALDAMPEDVAGVVRRLPEQERSLLTSQLKGLARISEGGPIDCGCQ